MSENVNLKKHFLDPNFSKDDKWSLPQSNEAKENEDNWGYSLLNGPNKWPSSCQNGIRQSPIDISAANVDFAFINKMYFENYEKSGKVTIKNLGQGGKILLFRFIYQNFSKRWWF